MSGKLLRRAAAESCLRPVKQCRVKVFPFPIESCGGVVEHFRLNYRRSVEAAHSSTSAIVRRAFPCTVFRLPFATGFSAYFGFIYSSRALSGNPVTIAQRGPRCRAHVKFGLKKLGGHPDIHRAHWVSRQKSVAAHAEFVNGARRCHPSVPSDGPPPAPVAQLRFAKPTLSRKKRFLGGKGPLSLARPKMIARCGR